jgi:hypothetical protein
MYFGKTAFLVVFALVLEKNKMDSMQARKRKVKSSQNQIIRKKCFKMKIKRENQTEEV